MSVQGLGSFRNPNAAYAPRFGGNRPGIPKPGKTACLAGCTCCCLVPVGILAGGVYLLQRMARKLLGRLKA